VELVADVDGEPAQLADLQLDAVAVHERGRPR